MEFDEFRTGYEIFAESWNETLTTALNKLFNKEFTLATEVGEDQAVQPVLEAYEFPLVWASFETTGSVPLNHALTLSIADASKLFAWMTGSDIPEELTEEQLNPLKDGLDQLIEQLAANQENGIEWEHQNLNLQLVSEPVDGISETGCNGTVTLTVDDETLSLHHLVWGYELVETADKADEGSGDFDSLFEGTEEEDVNVHPAEFENFSGGRAASGGANNLSMLLDVELEVFVELGRKKMLIKDLLKLGKGSIIELDKAAGEPLEIFVNGRKLADGEVVVVDDTFGIRITQIVGTLKEKPVVENV